LLNNDQAAATNIELRPAMAMIAYLTARGQKQGDIKGGATEKEREGSIPLISVAYDVETPLDPASGLPTGKRVHKPITVVKFIDQATPTLLQALVTNEVLTSVKIEFLRPVPEAVAPYFIISLTNALIVGIALAPSGEDVSNEYEQFTYQKITWSYPETGQSAEDDWSA
jgi:type VI secretion system secreted protein Hcp